MAVGSFQMGYLLTTSNVKTAKYADRYMRRQIVNIFKDEAKKAKKVFRETTKGWAASHKPKWKVKVDRSIKDITVTLQTGSAPFSVLETGTSTRWALMKTPPKTTPGSLKSAQGYKSFTRIKGKRAMQLRMMRARPGIVPRKFTHTYADRIKDEFRRRIEREMIPHIIESRNRFWIDGTRTVLWVPI
jgi:hypothetical protein